MEEILRFKIDYFDKSFRDLKYYKNTKSLYPIEIFTLAANLKDDLYCATENLGIEMCFGDKHSKFEFNGNSVKLEHLKNYALLKQIHAFERLRKLIIEEIEIILGGHHSDPKLQKGYKNC